MFWIGMIAGVLLAALVAVVYFLWSLRGVDWM